MMIPNKDEMAMQIFNGFMIISWTLTPYDELFRKLHDLLLSTVIEKTVTKISLWVWILTGSQIVMDDLRVRNLTIEQYVRFEVN